MKTLQFKLLISEKDIDHAISSRDFGSMKNKDGTIDYTNLNKFLKTVDIPINPVSMEQVHGERIGVVNDNKLALIENVDGLITNKKNIALCVFTADCLPILFFDKNKKIIAIVHAGRKGLLKGVIENMLKKLKEQFLSNLLDIIVGIGPGIEKKCYQVDGQFIDIRKIAIELLLNNGIKKENIENLDICTKCNKDLFYSYRGENNNNRFVSVISMS